MMCDTYNVSDKDKYYAYLYFIECCHSWRDIRGYVDYDMLDSDLLFIAIVQSSRPYDEGLFDIFEVPNIWKDRYGVLHTTSAEYKLLSIEFEKEIKRDPIPEIKKILDSFFLWLDKNFYMLKKIEYYDLIEVGPLLLNHYFTSMKKGIAKIIDDEYWEVEEDLKPYIIKKSLDNIHHKTATNLKSYGYSLDSIVIVE